jgi:hypothetical protein
MSNGRITNSACPGAKRCLFKIDRSKEHRLVRGREGRKREREVEREGSIECR